MKKLLIVLAVCVSGVLGHAKADNTTGLVGHWTFDEGSGSTAADSSGNGYTGTLTSGAGWTAGKIGSYALVLNGTTGAVNFAATPKLPDQFTLALWARSDGKLTGDPDEYLVAQYANIISPCYQGHPNFEIDTSPGGAVNSSGGNCPLTNVWTHYAATFDGSAARLYVNGVQVSSITKTGSVNSNNLNLWAGSYYGGASNNFHGAIDDLRLYNRALSSSEVLSLYSSNQSGQTNDNTPPTIPQDVTATAVSSQEIDLSWSPSTDPTVQGQTASGVVGYGIYRNGTLIVTTSQTSHSDMPLGSDTTFTYRVAAYDGAGNISEQSQSIQATTLTIPAEDFYFSDAGSDDGTTCAKAQSIDWLNQTFGFGTPTNWANPKVLGKIGPGDTVHLCGTIATSFNILGSGSPGKPITVIFEPDAKMSRAVWNPCAVKAVGVSYVVLDGGTNGLIEATDNGSPGEINSKTSQPFGNASDTTGVLGQGVDHFTVQNLAIHDMYVRPVTATKDENRIGSIVSLDGSNITVHNNDLSEGDTMIAVTAGGGNVQSTILIDGNRVQHANHGMFLGTDPNNAPTTVYNISNNSIDNLDWKDDPADCAPTGPCHHIDGIIFNDNGGAVPPNTRVNIFHNYFGPHFAYNNTAAIYEGGNPYPGIHIFNNVFVSSENYWGNGFIAADGSQDSFGLIVNNSFVSPNYSGGGAVHTGVHSYVYNNLTYGLSSGVAIYLPNDSAFCDVNNYQGPVGIADISDYNIYGFIQGAPPEMSFACHGTGVIYNDFNQWRSVSGQDAHSLAADPLLVNNSQGDYHLLSTSPAIGAGINLTSYCEITPLLCLDYDELQRPTTAPWSIGAYEANGVIPVAAAPVITAQPQNLSVTVGQIATFIFGVTGYPIPTYEWKKNGVTIDGASSPLLSTLVTSLSDNGAKFTCVATNALGSVTSSEATLTVTAGPPPTSPSGSGDTQFLSFKNVFNPTKETLTIKYALNGTDATLKVYDRQGIEIRTLADGTNNGSGYQTPWDGRNSQGSVVASGTYILVLKQGSTTIKKKVAVVK